MKRLIPIIAGLYPRPWRERYGPEFTALLEDVNPGPGAAFNIFKGAIAMQIRIWSYGWVLSISALLAATAFVVMLFTIPNNYVSQGTLLWNGAGPATHADLDSLKDAQERVESGPNLTSLVVSQNLYSRERSRMQLPDVIELMRRNVSIEPAGGPGSQKIVVVAFNYPDPQIAQRVTQALIGAFVDQSFNERSASPRDGSAASLQILDPPSLPLRTTRSTPALATAALLIGLTMLGLLALFRRRALRTV
jgi:hypothetical protein